MEVKGLTHAHSSVSVVDMSLDLDLIINDK